MFSFPNICAMHTRFQWVFVCIKLELTSKTFANWMPTKQQCHGENSHCIHIIFLLDDLSYFTAARSENDLNSMKISFNASSDALVIANDDYYYHHLDLHQINIIELTQAQIEF